MSRDVLHFAASFGDLLVAVEDYTDSDRIVSTYINLSDPRATTPAGSFGGANAPYAVCQQIVIKVRLDQVRPTLRLRKL